MWKRVFAWLRDDGHSWHATGAYGPTERVCLQCGKRQWRPTPAHDWYDE